MPELLDPTGVAACFGWQRQTVYRELWQSRAKVKRGQLLTPGDLPLPVRMAGRTPLWAEPDIVAAREARTTAPRAKPGRPSANRVRSLVASEVRPGDVLLLDGTRRRVVATRAGGTGTVELLLTHRKRDPGEWALYVAGDALTVYRPGPPGLS
jgi:hypothetical protein